MTIKINEIFHSIQGESLFSGLPCTFIRLSGCNLRCAYCDTRYAYEEGADMTTDDILQAISAYNCPLVEITGGEPLYQKETPELVQVLMKNQYTVLMETNGTYDINRVDNACIRIVDIKCPSSAESEKNDLENLNRLADKDQLKFVVSDKRDFDWAMDTLSTLRADFPRGNILFSPVADKLHPKELAEWVLKSGSQCRFQLQLHKIIWPDIERGV